MFVSMRRVLWAQRGPQSEQVTLHLSLQANRWIFHLRRKRDTRYRVRSVSKHRFSQNLGRSSWSKQHLCLLTRRSFYGDSVEEHHCLKEPAASAHLLPPRPPPLPSYSSNRVTSSPGLLAIAALEQLKREGEDVKWWIAATRIAAVRAIGWWLAALTTKNSDRKRKNQRNESFSLFPLAKYEKVIVHKRTVEKKRKQNTWVTRVCWREINIRNWDFQQMLVFVLEVLWRLFPLLQYPKPAEILHAWQKEPL